MTMTLIETKTLTSTATSIEFVSIPQNGTDLLVLASARRVETNSPFAVENVYFQINPGTGAGNIQSRLLVGDPPDVLSTTDAFGQIGYVPSGDATANTFGNISIYIPNYTSNLSKSISVDSVGENNGTRTRANISAGLLANTAAITAVKFLLFSGNLVAGSTVSLYKITKGSDEIVTTS